ncbi:hypothetical protein A9X05_09815 [Mycobacterium sp. E3298]|nr:fibronectin type III domain-containing protein [Mycobacterium sp. E3298]OBG93136.1 hypothetical protein A9X05_09815 [Mycobacterium sp. E3298]
MRISFSKSPQADVVGYRLYRSVNGGGFSRVGGSVLTGEDTRFIDYTSASNVEYAVTAVDVAGNESGRSASGSTGGGSGNSGGNGGGGSKGNIDTGLPPVDGDPTDPLPSDPVPTDSPGQAQQSVPSTPGGLTAQASSGGVLLSWNANPDTEKVTRYEVWYSASQQGNYRRLESTQSTQYEATGGNTAGWYRIRAVNEAGASDSSASIEVKNS